MCPSMSESSDRLGGRPVGLRHPPLAARQQPPADADQQLGEHRVLAREVPVEPGPADADRGAYLVHADAVEAALGEEPGGLLAGSARGGWGRRFWWLMEAILDREVSDR